MARTGFSGFPEEGLKFMRSLAKNNNRDWFQPRKEIFEAQVKQPMRELIAALNGEMSRFAPDHISDPDKAIYRIYRDTRFSKDKTPYKDHIAANFRCRGLAGNDGAGYYVAVSHKEVAVGGGIYMPMPDTLRTVRNYISEHHQKLRKIAESKPMKKLMGELHGERLSRVPKGFAADHPAADLLRLKSIFFYVELPPELAASKTMFAEVRKRFEAIAPLVDFLNAPLASARPKPIPHGFLD